MSSKKKETGNEKFLAFQEGLAAEYPFAVGNTLEELKKNLLKEADDQPSKS